MKRVIIILCLVLIQVCFGFNNSPYNKSLGVVIKRSNTYNGCLRSIRSSRNIDLVNDIKENDLIPNVKVMIDVKEMSNEETSKDTSEFQDVDTHELFQNKRILLISLPGAYTPTCTSKMIPEYEKEYDYFINEKKFDDIYCITNNDIYVLKNWFKYMDIKKIKYVSDGNSAFTERMNMLVDKSNFFLGMRPWRYVAIIENNVLKKMFQEENKMHNIQSDPYIVSSLSNVREFLKTHEI
ncbi:1-cys peroxiredoxin, putative [Hepatocystis sp. ex Piliocolobus tephrosceles]|nr:1-cys peroxiredoxin, putative [Hepatocystis sp. ex Piliocolobus tephrosceles]